MNGWSKALLAALLTIVLAWMGSIQKTVSDFHSGPNRDEISKQITDEAPWNKDRQFVLALISQHDRRISLVESRVMGNSNRLLRLELSVAQIQALDRFFCRTRAPKLPAC